MKTSIIMFSSCFSSPGVLSLAPFCFCRKGFFPNWARLGPWQLAFWITYEHSRRALGPLAHEKLRAEPSSTDSVTVTKIYIDLYNNLCSCHHLSVYGGILKIHVTTNRNSWMQYPSGHHGCRDVLESGLGLILSKRFTTQYSSESPVSKSWLGPVKAP